MARKKPMKLPNGMGGIVFLGNNRRKPYGIVITNGWSDEGKQIKKYIGYAENYTEAFKMLCNYNDKPYNFNLANITFEALYTKWLPAKEKEVSRKSYNRYTNAFKYFKKVHKYPFVKIGYSEMQKIIDECPRGYHTKSDIRTLYCQLYEYAIILELPVKERFTSSLKLGEKPKSEKHKNIQENDLKQIMALQNNLYEDIIKVMCFTGLRPSEILSIKNSNVFLNKKYMIGGAKTEAGKNRIIPINIVIEKIIIKYYNIENEYLFSENGKKITYRKLETNFNKIMSSLNFNYLPYDCRHTFATNLDYVENNQLIIKILMGHKVSDITKGTYTHKTIEDLLTATNKLSKFA